MQLDVDRPVIGPTGWANPPVALPTAPGTADRTARATPRFALRAARLFDGTGGQARPDPLIVIEDGSIVAVDDAATIGDPGCPVIDLGASSVVPGLIDTHTHLAWIKAESVDSGRVAAPFVAADRAALTLAGGVTVARDLGGPGDITLRLRDAIRAGVVVGPRLLVAGPPLTTPTGHCHWFGCTATTEAEVREAVLRLAALDVDVVKVMLTGGMATPSTDPYALQYPLEIARVLVDEAHRVGLPVAAHALGSDGVRVALACGVDTLEHGWTITGRAQHYDATVVDEMRRSTVVASVTGHHMLRELLPRDADGAGDLSELRRRLVPHRAVAAAGVPVVVHSDAGPGPTRYDGFGETLEVFAAGMDTSASAAIHAATLVPARALRLDAWVGSIQVGRVADLVTLDGDPDRDLKALRRVSEVRLGGRLVARDGALVAEVTQTPSRA